SGGPSAGGSGDGRRAARPRPSRRIRMRRPPLPPSTLPSIRSIDCGTNEGLASERIVAALGGRSWGFLPSVLADSLRLPTAVHHRVALRGVGATARGERRGRVEARVPRQFALSGGPLGQAACGSLRVSQS